MHPISQNRETSPTKSSASLEPLPDAWIGKIFDTMSVMYGSRFAAMWADSDAEKVRAMWAEKLGGFRKAPEAIRYALDALDDHPWPPTLPEFLALCRKAPKPETRALMHLPDAEELQRIMGIAEAAAQRMNPNQGDPLRWATKPASQSALNLARQGADKGHSGLQQVIAGLVADGIATASGKLIKRWDHGQWVAA